MKKSICLVLMALLLSASLFASTDVAARTEDGRIAILHGDNTYEYFVEDVPEDKVGFEVDVDGFMGIDWDSANLIRLGNVIYNGRFSKQYTLGNFYMLELKVSSDSATSVSGSWNAPVLRLASGDEINGFSQSMEQFYSASTFYQMKKGKSEKTTVYSIIFEVPAGETPLKVGITKNIDGATSWNEVGDEMSLN